MTTPLANWKGKSGKQYKYWVHPLDASWKDVPGNYIFAKRTSGGWKAIYVGQTKNLKSRLPRHEERACATKHGATHIHAHSNLGGETVRKAEERDLILASRPPCNDQLK